MNGQSILATAGPEARAIAELTWWMIGGGTVIMLIVVGFTAWAVWGPAKARGWLADSRTIMAGGFIFPVVVLSALLGYSMVIHAGARDLGPPTLHIDVTGEQWWWRVRYRDEAGTFLAETANEIHIPVGATVALTLTTKDVLHSFWVPALAGKLDMVPGQANVLHLRADKAGTYRGQCAEYCGGAHALMAFHVVADEPAVFGEWLAQQRQPVAGGGGRGRPLFLAAGCGACHSVRGTAATGQLGPDLTHVGARGFIGGGTLPLDRANLKAWIEGSQDIKPHNRMPSFGIFAEGEAEAIAAWLETLK